MNKDTFAATIIMLGWKKAGEYQYYNYIDSIYTLIICRDSGALLITNTIKAKNDVNEYQLYEELLKRIQANKI